MNRLRKKNHRTVWSGYCLLSLLVTCFLSACGGGGGNGGGVPDPEPTPDPDPVPEVTTGTVNFTPDWDGFPAASSLRIHFFPATGAVVTKDIDATGFSGTLENGTYQMLAYNTDATGVTFENADSYATAAVRVSPVEVPTRATSILMQPSSLLVLSQESVAVEKGGTLALTPTARSLTCTVNLTFEVNNASYVKELSGYMNGLLPSVLLATGKPDEASVTSATDCGIVFDVAMEGSQGTASFRSLGMADPKNGETYTCVLMLHAETTDGQEWDVEANMSKAITDALAAHEGSLPTNEPVGLKITVNATTAGMKAEVISWSDGSRGDVVLKPAE